MTPLTAEEKVLLAEKAKAIRVSIVKSVYLKFINIFTQTFYHTTHSSIQCLTVAAACQHSDSLDHRIVLLTAYCFLRKVDFAVV